MSKTLHFVKDFALFDKGIGEENRFVVIEGVDVDENGHFVGGIDPEKILADEAVKNGATRIPHSNCVDATGGGIVSADDRILYFNGGDAYIPSEESEMDRFLIKEGLLK